MSARSLIIIMLGCLLMALLSLAALLIYEPANREPLPEYGPSPDFELTDAEGNPLRRSDLEGKVWVVDFFFTSCAAVCPELTKNMQVLHQEFQDNENVRLVNFSVDPIQDTPKTLKKYAMRYRADTSRWHFLTSLAEDPVAEIRQIALDGFKLGGSNDIIIHSEKFALVDQLGMIRGYYEGKNPEAMPGLVNDIKKLLRE